MTAHLDWLALLQRGLWLALLLPLLALAVPTGAEPLRLDERKAIDAWPAVTVLTDAEQAYTVALLAGRPRGFEVPGGVAGNLGRRDQTVWLRIPVFVPGTAAQRRVLEIDYPSLNEVDLYVLQRGQVQAHHRCRHPAGAGRSGFLVAACVPLLDLDRDDGLDGRAGPACAGHPPQCRPRPRRE